MEENKYSDFLSNPKNIQKALELLDTNCEELDFVTLYKRFENDLEIKSGDGFPITKVFLDGLVCRARLNNSKFQIATSVNQIGAKITGVSQGRANPNNIPVFYGANNKETAAWEILQSEEAGSYEVTIGCWKSNTSLRLANLVDGSDQDLNELSFAHSMPEDYIKGWPEPQRTSALLLTNYFRKKFKLAPIPGLYNITNVFAAICYSLQDIDGIGYPAVSNKYQGYNIAIRTPSILQCVEVERWFIYKTKDKRLKPKLMNKGSVMEDGSISWPLNIC